MARIFSSNRNGGAFSIQTKIAVWQKATIVPGVDASIKRKDCCGAWIVWNQYGVTAENGMGWEIDHVVPVARGGTDDVVNLQPLQWENNRGKGDTWPNWSCTKTAKA